MKDDAISKEAREAIRGAGSPLLEHLGSLRKEELAVSQETEALEPQARLAFRRRGDEFLRELVRMRSGQKMPIRFKRIRRIAIAAACVLAVGIACLQIPEPKEVEPSQEIAVSVEETHGMPNPAVPEPSSGLLLVAGSAVLLLRRRRPRS